MNKNNNKTKFLDFPNKYLRSLAIKEYLEKRNMDKVVCFSCGNATKQLKKVGLDVLDISPNGDLLANRWFTGTDVAYYFNDRFNATSGYLSFEVMLLIAEKFKKYLYKKIKQTNYIHCGSGETIVCLKMAFPNKDFVAVYDNSLSATKYDKEAPLNKLVEILAKDVIIKHK